MLHVLFKIKMLSRLQAQVAEVQGCPAACVTQVSKHSTDTDK
jgi:hypothetical protein